MTGVLTSTLVVHSNVEIIIFTSTFCKINNCLKNVYNFSNKNKISTTFCINFKQNGLHWLKYTIID